MHVVQRPSHSVKTITSHQIREMFSECRFSRVSSWILGNWWNLFSTIRLAYFYLLFLSSSKLAFRYALCWWRSTKLWILPFTCAKTIWKKLCQDTKVCVLHLHHLSHFHWIHLIPRSNYSPAIMLCWFWHFWNVVVAKWNYMLIFFH